MNNVVLIGFSATGKTTVGRLLAERLRRAFIDVDELIAREAGRSIPEIFVAEGEPGFRQREARQLAAALREEGQVIAAGGGAPVPAENWRSMRGENCVVALTAEPATLRSRLDGTTDRPMLRDGVDAALERLLPVRLPRYLEADLVVATDGQDPPSVADTIVAALPEGGLLRIPVPVPGSPHEITVGRNLAHLVTPALDRAGVGNGIAVVHDAALTGQIQPLLVALPRRDSSMTMAIGPGEAAKSLGVLHAIYEELARVHLDRSGAVIAVGGGAVGDVAGFAAATWMRGVRLVQMPTTLLAMVDSSIGGKTGVNLPAGKNLVGAVHQPVAIFCDLAYLDTLPGREFQAGWAEIIKSAIIGDASLFERLHAARAALMARDRTLLPEILARTCALKARVVAEDPNEQGVRAVLNYGHTAGHALEAAAGFGTLLHGEAVAWGMRVAAHLSLRLGRCSPAAVQAQDELLRAYGFTATVPRVDRSRLLVAMTHDKKVQAGSSRWVLLREIGQVEYGCSVAYADVEAAIDEALAA